MQFIVPKFIEMEDKVIGPLTWKQFVAFLFAFYKPQGRPFSVYLKNAINYLLQPKLYIWKKR